jgi:hypothetical protein
MLACKNAVELNYVRHLGVFVRRGILDTRGTRFVGWRLRRIVAVVVSVVLPVPLVDLETGAPGVDTATVVSRHTAWIIKVCATAYCPAIALIPQKTGLARLARVAGRERVAAVYYRRAGVSSE